MRQGPVTPKVEDKISHSSQHLLNSVESLHHGPNFPPEYLSTYKVELVMLGGDPSISAWKTGTRSRGVKRTRSLEDNLSGADLRPKRERTTQHWCFAKYSMTWLDAQGC